MKPFLIVCKKCGAMYDGGNPVGLKGRCPTYFTGDQNATNWKRAAEGKHPKAAKFREAKVLEPLIALSQIEGANTGSASSSSVT